MQSDLSHSSNHKKKIRIVTATSLFDGHDAAINIFRRILISFGAEIIHLGHDRSVAEIVRCAIQEDVHAIAVTSYQGGHLEYLKYMYDLLKQKNAGHIKIFAGGGGTILPDEIKELEGYGITKIYHPDDGRRMGLEGMIQDLLEKCEPPQTASQEAIGNLNNLHPDNISHIAQCISMAENKPDAAFFQTISKNAESMKIPVLGITGTGGAGKSSIIDEIVLRFLQDFPKKNIAIVCVDPTKRKTGGALLGDRIRMNSIDTNQVYMRSMATRQSNVSLTKSITDTINILKTSGFDLIILETSGIGQSDSQITEHADKCMYIMSPEYGAATQLEKIDMLDFADIIAINKSDRKGASDALRDVKKQYRRNHNKFEISDDQIPVYACIASKFNDVGITKLYSAILGHSNIKKNDSKKSSSDSTPASQIFSIIPGNRVRYLEEVAENIRSCNNEAKEQSIIAQKIYALDLTKEIISESEKDQNMIAALQDKLDALKQQLKDINLASLLDWENKKEKYRQSVFEYTVREKTISIQTHIESLAEIDIPRVCLPSYKAWGDILAWILQENVPGEFPFTAGIFPFKRQSEDPARMFAGEGGPERTNKRFHYLSQNTDAIRLSTAFDSVTLYGSDPDIRPDIYGKIGNSGVSISCLDDMKKLFSGFDLSDPSTSVSMTINGPAPMILGFYLNTAIDQACEKYIKNNGLTKQIEKKLTGYFKDNKMQRPKYQSSLPSGNNGLGLFLLGTTGDQVLPGDIYESIKADTLKQIRGTVQADILKEDQAQNTCIFSTEFALRMMGDVQEYFIANKIQNFYSVSISGYHIAEAGANPVTQLAFTLANGFTYVEYYLSRGMDINDFGPNLSFFFSNGIDPEYAVIGRVARRIWAKAMKYKYNANERAQKLKYHIQTSGRSLHAQEIDFNDIRTTLQALYAIYDNCNSLHTNAYDEAITTPTEDSVRRALAIQLIINKELGLTKNENPLQGSFIIEELTNLVEEAVLYEFEQIGQRGGVLGAMETMYQRSKIQEESLKYEQLKHTGEFPIIGVNTFLKDNKTETIIPEEIIRATDEEKKNQIDSCKMCSYNNKINAEKTLKHLIQSAKTRSNLFNDMIEACKYNTLGEMSKALFQIGGKYRRNM